MGVKIKAVVLAAGKGTRMQDEASDAPKVMRQVCGKPMIWYVLDALSFIDKRDIIIVVGYKKEDVIACFGGYTFAVQEEQLGTGHATMAAQAELAGFDGAVLICCGDMPLIMHETYESLLREHLRQENDCTILTSETTRLLPFGRIVRDEKGGFSNIVEDKDCTQDQLRITELNTGLYVFSAQLLLTSLKELKAENAQGEYYLTDIPAIMRATGAKVGTFKQSLDDGIIGVNTLEQLVQVEGIIKQRGTGN